MHFIRWMPAAIAAGWMAGALAAPVPTFSATASGAVSNLSLTATLNVGDADAGRSGNIYLAASIGGALFVNNGANWAAWSSGPLPVYASGPLGSRSIPVVSTTTLTALAGTQVYLGYGLSEADMLANGKFGLIYTVPAGATGSTAAIDASALASGRILFGATGTSNPGDPYRLFVMNADGSGRTEITTQQGSYASPDIESLAGGGWVLAYSRLNQLRTFNTRTATETAFASPVIGDRPDIEAGGARFAFQGGASGESGLNIYLANADGSGTPQQLTRVVAGTGSDNAEWPYFVPGANRITYLLGTSVPPRRIMATDGSGDAAIAAPGGFAVSHISFKADGSEFFQAQRMTSYVTATGAAGTLNDLKGTTALLQQLGALGLASVPATQIPGQGQQGTFALSADWSRGGERLVFDALVADAASGAIRGIAIFTWDIAARRLALVYGPEPLTAARTNNYNYSMGTPKWIP